MGMNLDGITVKLEIRGYTKYNRESEGEPRWCRLDFSFISQPWLRYKRQDDEVLTNEEVEALAEHLERLLNGRRQSLNASSRTSAFSLKRRRTSGRIRAYCTSSPETSGRIFSCGGGYISGTTG